MDQPREFYFVPYNGKGGVMLEEDPMAGETMRILDQDIIRPKYREFEMKYLPRIYDKGKYRRREANKAKQERKKQDEIAQLRKQGYISMSEMRETSKLSYSTLYNAISDGKMEGTNVHKTWFVKKEDFQSYLERYKPKPRSARREPTPDDRSPEARLLDAIYKGRKS